MEQIVFGPADATRDLWHLSDRQLAGVCRMIVEGRLANTTGVLRAEAMRLFLVWLDALNRLPQNEEDRARSAALLSGLRKRTIQVLIKLSRMARPLTPES